MTIRHDVLVNGICYNVLDESNGFLQIRRPHGVKIYWARRCADSPLYGENRAYILEQVEPDQTMHYGGTR